MTFTWKEQVQCVALFTSVITILLASVQWNFIRQFKADNLPLGQKLKVVPFFLASILMKMFVTSSLVAASLAKPFRCHLPACRLPCRLLPAHASSRNIFSHSVI